MKKCFGIVSWFPDNEIYRKQRIDRLNTTFKQLIGIFGADINFLIVAQNWKDYQIPDFIKNVEIFNYDKLGILGARKTLRKHFLESAYDYLIMCDDDIVLELEKGYTGKMFLKELENHPEGFMFIRYGWSLTFCAISRWVYEQVDMVDIDPEKGEGYEDTAFPNLLHYRFPDKEFHIPQIDFVQHKAQYRRTLKSTWDGHVNHRKLKFLTDFYIDRFKKGQFEINEKIKQEALDAWDHKPMSELDYWINTSNLQVQSSKSEKVVKLKASGEALPSLSDWVKVKKN